MRRFEHTSGLRKSGHICALRQDDVRQNNPFLPFRWRGRSANLPDVLPVSGFGSNSTGAWPPWMMPPAARATGVDGHAKCVRGKVGALGGVNDPCGQNVPQLPGRSCPRATPAAGRRRSTATSCRSTVSSASLEADDRPSSQLQSRTKMR
jgi:hypothetical protein